MLKQIKMSYAGKDVRLTVDEKDKLVKVEVRKSGDPNQFEEVKSSWIGKTPSWNKLNEFLSEAAGVKVQRRRLFDSFEAVKMELMDAPTEVKEAYNKVAKYFDTKLNNGFGVVSSKEFRYENISGVKTAKPINPKVVETGLSLIKADELVKDRNKKNFGSSDVDLILKDHPKSLDKEVYFLVGKTSIGRYLKNAK